MLAAVVDVACIVAVARLVDRAQQLVPDDLGKADDGVQWRPQLVAHVGEERRLGAVGVFRPQLGGHQILLHALALGDVGGDADHVALAAAHRDRRLAREQPELRAVGAGQHLLALVRRVGGEHLAVGFLEDGGLLRRHDVVIGEADQRVVRPAEQLAERLVEKSEAQLLVLDEDRTLDRVHDLQQELARRRAGGLMGSRSRGRVHCTPRPNDLQRSRSMAGSISDRSTIAALG